MNDGFIKVAAATAQTAVADVSGNVRAIKEVIAEADRRQINLLVLPEMCLTGYACGDLLYADALIFAAYNALDELCRFTAGRYPAVIVGLPIRHRCKLYNAAAVIVNGRLLGLVPKMYLPNYGEFYEERQFAPAAELENGATIDIGGDRVPFGSDLLFCHNRLDNYTFGVEICEDAWAPKPPSTDLCLSGATLIANLSASTELIGKQRYRRTLLGAMSSRLLCGYVYACSGVSESSGDAVYAAHRIILENGIMLAENKPFGGSLMTVSDIDVDRLAAERRRVTSFRYRPSGVRLIPFEQEVRRTELTRAVGKDPFLPPQDDLAAERADLVLKIQSHGLGRRIEQMGADNVVVDVNCGLDGALSLVAAARAADLARLDRSKITAAIWSRDGLSTDCHQMLCECLGVRAETGRSAADIANETGGHIVASADLTDWACGCADAVGLPAYGVNCTVPKTLVRYILRHVADSTAGKMQGALINLLDRFESDADNCRLNDFFLYYTLRFGFAPHKIFRLAQTAFKDECSARFVFEQLEQFLRQFFSQQYKRIGMPDGPKVCPVSLSPRSDRRMPCGAPDDEWLNDLNSVLPLK